MAKNILKKYVAGYRKVENVEITAEEMDIEEILKSNYL